MGTLLAMSRKERDRLKVVPQVASGRMTLVEAALLLGLSTRQVRRVVRRYTLDGDVGVIHRSRGRASSRATRPEIKQWALALYKARYSDYPPTHASEALAEDDVAPVRVHPETLRLWLKDAGLWSCRTSRRRHRTWRRRKARFGEMVQIDGSVHRWFEDRGLECFEMTMVDDATGETHTLFSAQETTEAAMLVLEGWVLRYGIPQSLYADLKSVYVTDREPTVAEQLSGMKPLTQFGRACHRLGIRIIEAYSPQAKGRVERKHGVLQERQIRDMRQAGICDIASANAFLPAWLESFNHRFARPARDPRDAHRPLPPGLDLRSVFCHEETRCIANDWTIRFHNRRFQVVRQPGLPPVRSSLRVQKWRDETIHVYADERELLIREIPLDAALPRKAVQVSAKPQAVVQQREDHSWRTGRYLPIDTATALEQREELARTYLPDPTVAGIPVALP